MSSRYITGTYCRNFIKQKIDDNYDKCVNNIKTSHIYYDKMNVLIELYEEMFEEKLEEYSNV